MVNHLELRVGGLAAELRFRNHRVIVDAAQPVRRVVGQVLNVRGGQRCREKAQARFDLACRDRCGAGVEGVSDVEQTVDAHVEHVNPTAATLHVTQREHERTAHRRGCETKGDHRSIDPNVVTKIEHALVGPWTFERGRQVGCVTDIEHNTHG